MALHAHRDEAARGTRRHRTSISFEVVMKGSHPSGHVLLRRAERVQGRGQVFFQTLMPRFATHPATGEVEGVRIKRFPERARRPREEKRLF